MWRVTKTAEQKIGVQFAVRPGQRAAHSSPWQAPPRFIINNNTTRLDGPVSGYRPRAIYKLDDTRGPARVCPPRTWPLPSHPREHTCRRPACRHRRGSCPVGRKQTLGCPEHFPGLLLRPRSSAGSTPLHHQPDRDRVLAAPAGPRGGVICLSLSSSFRKRHHLPMLET